MNEVKVLSNAISEAITAVKHAEKCCLDITTSDKLDIVKDLMEVESQIRMIMDALPVPEQEEHTDVVVGDWLPLVVGYICVGIAALF